MRKIRDIMISRHRMHRIIRAFFDARGFCEVDTPILVESPCMEPHLDVFETEFTPEIAAQGRSPVRRFLPTSPEFHMKRLLAAGAGNIYQIARAFRNGELGGLHEPEFALLEWYRPNASYETVMDDTEDLIKGLHRILSAGRRVIRSGRELSIHVPWIRMTVAEAWERYAGIPVMECGTASSLVHAGRAAGVSGLNPTDDWDTAYFKIFFRAIEPHLGFPEPVILYEYPASMSALARIKPDDPRVALRFELYIGGIELANAFDELRDSAEQLRRFEVAGRERQDRGLSPHPVDQGLIEALRHGLPPCAGIALGLDRLLMILLNAETIQEVLLFPFESERSEF